MNTADDGNHQFLSTSDFIEKLNECIRSAFDDKSSIAPNRSHESSGQTGQSYFPKFELRSRFSDGTTRLVDDTERSYADYKFKFGQVCMYQ